MHGAPPWEVLRTRRSRQREPELEVLSRSSPEATASNPLWVSCRVKAFEGEVEYEEVWSFAWNKGKGSGMVH